MRKIIPILSLLLIMSCGKYLDKFYEHYAKELAEGKVTSYLKHPDSAKFSSNEDTKFTETVYRDLKGFIIKGYVDSKNELGAVTRKRYSIEIYHKPDLDEYKFTNFELVED